MTAMWTLKLGLVLVCCTVLISAKVKEFNVLSMELSPESAEILTIEHKITQLNGSAIAITADIEQKVDLDNSYNIQVVLSMVTRGNSYFEVYRTKSQGICDFTKTMTAKFAPELSELEICPIPKGSYSFEDQVLNVEPSIMNMAVPGKFKTDIILTQGGAEKMKMTMFLELKK